MCSIRQNKGFTLLEVLIALSLLAILSAALYGTYFSVMRARESAMAGMEANRELRGTLDMLRRELSSAFYNKNNKKLQFVAEDRDIYGKPASTLTFTTILQPRLPASDQVTVKYTVRETAGKLLLTRQETGLYFTKEDSIYPQMENLEGFLVECSSDGSKWVRSWDTALNLGGLPKYVKVTIRIKEGNKTVELGTFATPRIEGT